MGFHILVVMLYIGVTLSLETEVSNSGICDGHDGILPNPDNCSMFYVCANDTALAGECSEGLLFNQQTMTCDFSQSVDCEYNAKNITRDNSLLEISTEVICETTTCTCIYPSESNCRDYYRCENGVAYKETCSDGLAMNIDEFVCDYEDIVDCDDTSSSTNTVQQEMNEQSLEIISDDDSLESDSLPQGTDQKKTDEENNSNTITSTINPENNNLTISQEGDISEETTKKSSTEATELLTTEILNFTTVSTTDESSSVNITTTTEYVSTVEDNSKILLDESSTLTTSSSVDENSLNTDDPNLIINTVITEPQASTTQSINENTPTMSQTIDNIENVNEDINESETDSFSPEEILSEEATTKDYASHETVLTSVTNSGSPASESEMNLENESSNIQKQTETSQSTEDEYALSEISKTASISTENLEDQSIKTEEFIYVSDASTHASTHAYLTSLKESDTPNDEDIILAHSTSDNSAPLTNEEYETTTITTDDIYTDDFIISEDDFMPYEESSSITDDDYLLSEDDIPNEEDMIMSRQGHLPAITSKDDLLSSTDNLSTENEDISLTEMTTLDNADTFQTDELKISETSSLNDEETTTELTSISLSEVSTVTVETITDETELKSETELSKTSEGFEIVDYTGTADDYYDGSGSGDISVSEENSQFTADEFSVPSDNSTVEMTSQTSEASTSISTIDLTTDVLSSVYYDEYNNGSGDDELETSFQNEKTADDFSEMTTEFIKDELFSTSASPALLNTDITQVTTSSDLTTTSISTTTANDISAFDKESISTDTTRTTVTLSDMDSTTMHEDNTNYGESDGSFTTVSTLLETDSTDEENHSSFSKDLTTLHKDNARNAENNSLSTTDVSAQSEDNVTDNTSFNSVTIDSITSPEESETDNYSLSTAKSTIHENNTTIDSNSSSTLGSILPEDKSNDGENYLLSTTDSTTLYDDNITEVKKDLLSTTASSKQNEYNETEVSTFETNITSSIDWTTLPENHSTDSTKDSTKLHAENETDLTTIAQNNQTDNVYMSSLSTDIPTLPDDKVTAGTNPFTFSVDDDYKDSSSIYDYENFDNNADESDELDLDNSTDNTDLGSGFTESPMTPVSSTKLISVTTSDDVEPSTVKISSKSPIIEVTSSNQTSDNGTPVTTKTNTAYDIPTTDFTDNPAERLPGILLDDFSEMSTKDFNEDLTEGFSDIINNDYSEIPTAEYSVVYSSTFYENDISTSITSEKESSAEEKNTILSKSPATIEFPTTVYTKLLDDSIIETASTDDSDTYDVSNTDYYDSTDYTYDIQTEITNSLNVNTDTHSNNPMFEIVTEKTFASTVKPTDAPAHTSTVAFANGSTTGSTVESIDESTYTTNLDLSTDVTTDEIDNKSDEFTTLQTNPKRNDTVYSTDSHPTDFSTDTFGDEDLDSNATDENSEESTEYDDEAAGLDDNLESIDNTDVQKDYTTTKLFEGLNENVTTDSVKLSTNQINTSRSALEISAFDFTTESNDFEPSRETTSPDEIRLPSESLEIENTASEVLSTGTDSNITNSTTSIPNLMTFNTTLSETTIKSTSMSEQTTPSDDVQASSLRTTTEQFCECGPCKKADSLDCTKYEECVDGKYVSKQCEVGLLFSVTLEACDFGSNVQCDREYPECENGDGFFADSDNCSLFLQCHGGIAYKKSCPGSLLFNPLKRTCDTKSRCGMKPVTPTSKNLDVDCDCDECVMPDAEDCSKYYLCVDGHAYDESCGDGLAFNVELGTCDFDGVGACAKRSSICEEDNGNYKHETNCSRYFHCAAGVAQEKQCDADEHFDEKSGSCEEPCVAMCDTSLNCNATTPIMNQPAVSTAIAICDDPEGYYPNYEDCRTFYKCTKGIPTLAECVENEHFNAEDKVCEDPCDAMCDFNLDCVKPSDKTTTILTETTNSAVTTTENSTDQPVSTDIVTTTHTETTTEILERTTNQDTKTPLEILTSTSGTITPLSETMASSSETMASSSGTMSSSSETMTSLSETMTSSSDTMTSSSDTMTSSSETMTEKSGSTTLTPTDISFTSSTSSAAVTTDSTKTTQIPSRTTEIISTSMEVTLESSTTTTITVPSSSEFISTTSTISSSSVTSKTSTIGHTEDESLISKRKKSPICIDSNGAYPNIDDCSSFFLCTDGKALELNCSDGLHFSESTKQCESPCSAMCDTNIICTTLGHESTPVTFSMCSVRDVLPAKGSCDHYTDCTSDVPQTKKCPKSLHFNPSSRSCDFQDKAGCGKPSKPLPPIDNTHKCGCMSCIEPSENCVDYYVCLNGSAHSMRCSKGLRFDRDLQTCNLASRVSCILPTATTKTTSVVTPTPFKRCPKRNGMFKNPSDCGSFIHCSNYRPSMKECAIGTHFSVETQRCEQPCDANCDPNLMCGTTAPPTTDPLCPCLNCLLPSTESCNRYIKCAVGRSSRKVCPRGQAFDPDRFVCDWAHRVSCEQSEVCPRRSGLFPFKEDCHKFVHCSNGIPYIKNCPGNLQFDVEKLRCEWPSEKCSSIAHTPKKSDNELALKSEHDQTWRCPSSFGFFRHEEQCNKYYLCDHDNPKEMTCSESLQYNPKYKTCDWPRNVKCGSEDYPYQKRCRRSNRDLTCPQNRTNMPHAHCDMFYDCSTGSACPKRCPDGLFFNELTLTCDVPAKVNCKARDGNLYTLTNFAEICRQKRNGHMIDPANPSCYFRCSNRRVTRGCCSKNRIFDEKLNKCNWQGLRIRSYYD